MVRLWKYALLGICIGLLTACSTTIYFPTNDLHKNSLTPLFQDMYADYLKISQEPSLWEISQKDIEAEQYRVLVLSGITAVHSVRLKVKTDCTGTVVVKKLDSGSRMVGDRIIEGKYLKMIPLFRHFINWAE